MTAITPTAILGISAYYHDSAAVLIMDGRIVAAAQEERFSRVKHDQTFPHSIGLFYSAFTYYCGFKVNDGEYKLMGLAPYGKRGERLDIFKEKILSELVDLRVDGSFALNMGCFNFTAGLTMTNDAAWERLFGMPRRQPETRLEQEYMDLALACQEVTEEIVLRLARTAKKLSGSDNLTLAGGVALNCVANSRILREGIFRALWIQPASGDAGGALGAAFAGWHIWLDKPRLPESPDSMQGTLLGPDYSDREIERVLARHGALYRRFGDSATLCNEVASLISEGNVIGWFQGKMEYGPRALGNRSILADPRNPEMQKKLNLKIKFREGFRPFAPAVLQENSGDYFELDRPAPYMLLTAPVKLSRRTPPYVGSDEDDILERLNRSRSDIPAVTHIDYSARVQTVDRYTNPKFCQLLEAFHKLTGCAVLVNTSFNVRDEPIVCTPEDAWRCFMATEMDYLVMGNLLVVKKDSA